MKSCWEARPDGRPSFSQIRQQLAAQLESITDECCYSYLKLNAKKDYYNASQKERIEQVGAKSQSLIFWSLPSFLGWRFNAPSKWPFLSAFFTHTWHYLLLCIIMDIIFLFMLFIIKRVFCYRIKYLIERIAKFTGLCLKKRNRFHHQLPQCRILTCERHTLKMSSSENF